jgi:hypothetical protein
MLDLCRMMTYLRMIQEVIEFNGWSDLLIAEEVPPPGPPGWVEGRSIVRVRRKEGNPHELSDLVGVYVEAISPPEQVQSEALRFLRTGHTGA